MNSYTKLQYSQFFIHYTNDSFSNVLFVFFAYKYNYLKYVLYIVSYTSITNIFYSAVRGINNVNAVCLINGYLYHYYIKYWYVCIDFPCFSPSDLF